LLPPIRILLANLNPIIHGGKYAAAFGSYGWSGEAVPRIEHRLDELKMKLAAPGLKVKFRASKEQKEEARCYGDNFAKAMFGEMDIKALDHGACKVK
ncbi:MAG: MBL fold metallo-hydrolase, partial [Clostridium sp.]